MSIKAICNSKVVTIQKNAILADVVDLMQKHHVGSVVVVEPLKGKMIPSGIITDRDIALTIGHAKSPSTLKIEQVMQSAPLTINENQGIYEAILQMQKYGVKRLPVIQADGSLVGIISKNDILKLMGAEVSNLSKIGKNQIANEQGVKLPAKKNLTKESS